MSIFFFPGNSKPGKFTFNWRQSILYWKSGNLVEATRRHASCPKLYIFFKLPPAALPITHTLPLFPKTDNYKHTKVYRHESTHTNTNTHKHTFICKCAYSPSLTSFPFNKYQVHAESFILLTSCLKQPPPEHRGGHLPFPAVLWGRQFRQSTLWGRTQFRQFARDRSCPAWQPLCL